jgi:CRP-like cAMP-binding protein
MLAFLLPGDVCDLNSFVLERTDHSILALTDVTVARLTPEAVEELTDGHPRLLRALWWAQLVDQAITREWVMNTGQRTALERTAHLLCELFWRLRAVGQTRGDTCELPITQIELGDTLGLSSVHVNRMLQELRREGLIVLRDRELVIADLELLQSAALFDPGYLHLRELDRAAPQAGRARQSA